MSAAGLSLYPYLSSSIDEALSIGDQRYAVLKNLAATEHWHELSILALETTGVSQQLLDNLMCEAQESRQRSAKLVTRLNELVPELGGVDEVERLKAILDAADGEGEEYLSLQQEAMKASIGLGVRGLLAMVHGEFNLAYSSTMKTYGSETKQRLLSSPGLMLDQLKIAIAPCRSSLESAQRDIYGALISGNESQVITAAKGLIGKGAVELRKLVRIGLNAQGAMAALLELGKNSVAEQIGGVAAEAGQLIREVIASSASAQIIVTQIAGIERSKDASRLIDAAVSLPFMGELPNGKDVEISKIEAVTPGSYVEVRGIAQKIETLKLSDKNLVSRLWLHDPSSRSDVVLVAPYVHFVHSGMVPGCYCRASGIWVVQSSMLNGESAIEIEQLALKTKYAKTSWKIAFLTLAEAFYPCWLGGLNLQHSLGQHRGENEPKDSHLGAGELIYQPLAR